MSKILTIGFLYTLFSAAYFGFNVVNFYQAKYIKFTFKDLAFYNLYLLGFYWVLNLLITYTFHYGMNKLEHMWTVNLIYWLAAILPAFIMTYIMFRQLPSPTEWIGLALIFGGILVITIK